MAWDRYQREFKTFHQYEHLVEFDDDPDNPFLWACQKCGWDSSGGEKPAVYPRPVGMVCPECLKLGQMTVPHKGKHARKVPKTPQHLSNVTRMRRATPVEA